MFSGKVAKVGIPLTGESARQGAFRPDAKRRRTTTREAKEVVRRAQVASTNQLIRRMRAAASAQLTGSITVMTGVLLGIWRVEWMFTR